MDTSFTIRTPTAPAQAAACVGSLSRFRFAPESGHQLIANGCLLCANSGHLPSGKSA